MYILHINVFRHDGTVWRYVEAVNIEQLINVLPSELFDVELPVDPHHILQILRLDDAHPGEVRDLKQAV